MFHTFRLTLVLAVSGSDVGFYINAALAFEFFIKFFIKIVKFFRILKRSALNSDKKIIFSPKFDNFQFEDLCSSRT